MRGLLSCWLLGLGLGLGCGDASTQTPSTPAEASEAPQVAKPEDHKVRAWLGDLSDLEPEVRAGFEASWSDFPPLRPAGGDDWLTLHHEDPQTVGTFWVSNPNRVGAGGRGTLYILPLGTVPMLPVLEAYAEAFFGLPVVVLPPVDISDEPLTRRMNEPHRQVLAGDLQAYLQSRLPEDAYAMIGLTMEDLYPGESWNYVFGMASVKRRTGVFSFARYDARFYDATAEPNPQRLQRRAIKILSHEVGHMFGITHCVHFSCIMNGANHAEELDSAPPHLCPVCLRKLHMLTEFDLQQRYSDLKRHYQALGWAEAAWFVDRRGKRIEDAAGSRGIAP